MTAIDLVQAVVAAGATVQVKGGVPSLKGEVPSEVLAGIRTDREAFLEAWEDYRRSRYCVPPPPSLPLRREPPRWRADVWKRVDGYVRRQTDEVCRWLGARLVQYTDAGMNPREAAQSACMDVLAWQMERHRDPVAAVTAFDEDLKRKTP